MNDQTEGQALSDALGNEITGVVVCDIPQIHGAEVIIPAVAEKLIAAGVPCEVFKDGGMPRIRPTSGKLELVREPGKNEWSFHWTPEVG